MKLFLSELFGKRKKKKALLLLLGEWDKWVEDGAKKHPKFSRHWGLCETVVRNDCDKSALKEMFANDGLDTVYPFNSGATHFNREMYNCAVHMNAQRVLWVKGAIRHEKT